MQSGDLERAERYLNMACDFYRHSEMVPYLVRSLASLAQLYERQKRLSEVRGLQAEAERLMQKLI